MKVSEIFESIQGEGRFIGEPQVFVRLAGCNMRCTWCIGVKPGRRIPRIITSNCANKKIMDVEKGDKLLSLGDDGRLVETTVIKVMKRTVKEHIEVKVEGKPFFYFTPEHEIRTNNGWTKIEDLQVGDEVYFIKPNEKNRFFAKHYNCMFNKKVALKSAKNTDYKAVGKKTSNTKKRLIKEGLPTPTMTFLKDNNPIRYNQIRRLHSERMKLKNPMTESEIVEKVVKTSKKRGHYAKASERMRKNNPTKSPRFREYITKNNPMKNPEVAMKNWKSHQRRPSGIEKKAIKIAEDANLPLHYIGNGKLWVGAKEDKMYNPDFVVKGQKKVVEVYDPTYFKRGGGWSNQRKKHFTRYGYQCLMLPITWKTKEENIQKKLRKFISNGLRVISIRRFKSNKKYPCQNPKPLTVYNFECEPSKNYFVDYLLVHNCDTKYAWEGGKENSVQEVVDVVKSYKLNSVCITGGEPLLQADELLALIRALKDDDIKILLETNGSIYDIQVFNEVDYVALDLKPPSSGEKSDEFILSRLRSCDYVKVVVDDDEDFAYAKKIICKSGVEVFLQPSDKVKFTWLADKVLEDKLNVRVLPQLHKVMGIK